MRALLHLTQSLCALLAISSLSSGLVVSMVSAEYYLDYRHEGGRFQALGRQTGDWVDIPVWVWVTGAFSSFALAAAAILAVFIAFALLVQGARRPPG